MLIRTFQQNTKYLPWISLFIGVFCFLFMPMKSVRSLIPGIEKHSDTLSYFALLAGVLGAITLYLLDSFYKMNPVFSILNAVSLPQKLPKLVTYLQILLSLLILAKVIHGMDRPFETDELHWEDVSGDQAYALPKYLKFLNQAYHPIATESARLSVKLFGLHTVTARIPAVIFSIVFLIILFFFTSRNLSTYVTLVLYLNFLFNELLLFYMHSVRGYILAITLCLSLQWIVWEVITQRIKLNIRVLRLFYALLILAPFCHFFSCLYVLLMCLGLISWTWYYQEQIGKEHYLQLRQLVTAILFIFPFYALCLVFSFIRFASSEYMLGNGGSEIIRTDAWTNLMGTAGVSHLVCVKLAVLLCLIYFYQIFKSSRKKMEPRLLLGFFMAWFVMVVIVSQRILSAALASRYFIQFLIILIPWLALESESFSKRGYKYVLAVLTLGLLVIEPMIYNDIYHYMLNQDVYYRFVKKTQKIVQGVKPACLDFTYGIHWQYARPEKLYFHEDKKKADPTCDLPQKYEIYFACMFCDALTETQLLTGFEIKTTDKFRQMKEIYSDRYGNSVFLKDNKSM